jgi:hypothetical protein
VVFKDIQKGKGINTHNIRIQLRPKLSLNNKVLPGTQVAKHSYDCCVHIQLATRTLTAGTTDVCTYTYIQQCAFASSSHRMVYGVQDEDGACKQLICSTTVIPLSSTHNDTSRSGRTNAKRANHSMHEQRTHTSLHTPSSAKTIGQTELPTDIRSQKSSDADHYLDIWFMRTQ